MNLLWWQIMYGFILFKDSEQILIPPPSLKCSRYRCVTKTYDNLLVGTQKRFLVCYKYIGGV